MVKANPYITAALVFGVVLVGLLYLRELGPEGFTDALKSRYQILRSQMADIFNPFVKLQKEIQKTLLDGIKSSNEPGDPNMRLQMLYVTKMGGLPLDRRMFELPLWSDNTVELSLALAAIPNDLAQKVQTEITFYETQVEFLANAFNKAADPSKLDVDTLKREAEERLEKEKEEEGFEGSTCSAEMSLKAREAIKMEKLKVEQERMKSLLSKAKGVAPDIPCPTSPFPDQLSRVEKLIADPKISNLKKSILATATKVTKFNSDFEALKNGKLYDWQKSVDAGAVGPDGKPIKKTYARFTGKSNLDGLFFSVRQSMS